MQDKILNIIQQAGTIELMEKVMSKILDSITAQQQYYYSEEEYNDTVEAISKFKQLYKEKLPSHANSILVPLYEDYFTEEEIDEIIQIQGNPLFSKMKKFSEVVTEKSESSLKEFTSEIFQEAFAKLITKAATLE